MKKNGSCLLILVIISAIMLLYYTNLWQSNSFMAELNYKRYDYEKKFRLTESLFNFGLLTSINNYVNIIAQKNDKTKFITLHNASWPSNSNNLGIFLVSFLRDNKILLTAKVKEEKSKDAFQINAILEVDELIENPKQKKQKKLRKFNLLNWQVN